jgi:hypothetical protein
MAVAVSAEYLRTSTWSRAPVNEFDIVSLSAQANGRSEATEPCAYDDCPAISHEQLPRFLSGLH